MPIAVYLYKLLLYLPISYNIYPEHDKQYYNEYLIFIINICSTKKAKVAMTSLKLRIALFLTKLSSAFTKY